MNTSQNLNTFMIMAGVFVIIGIIIFSLIKFFAIYGGIDTQSQTSASAEEVSTEE